MLSRIKRFLPREQRIAYYNAIIKQTMLFASTVWSACSIGNFQRVVRLQKRYARVILDADTRANNAELFEKLNWLPLQLEVKANICTQVYKPIYGQSPSYMNDLLVLNSDLNDRCSRNGSLNLVFPRFKQESEGGRTFALRAARLWNTIPNFLKKIECVHRFNKALQLICMHLLNFLVVFLFLVFFPFSILLLF